MRVELCSSARRDRLGDVTDAIAERMARPGLEPSGRRPRSGHGCHRRAYGETRTRTVRTTSPVRARMPSPSVWRDPDSNRPDDVPGQGTDAIAERMARPGLEPSGRRPRSGHGCHRRAYGETRTRTVRTTSPVRARMPSPSVWRDPDSNRPD